MNKVTTKLVTEKRLRELLDCYGSDSSSWPEDERQAALSLLRGMPELQTYREDVRALDTLLINLRSRESQAVADGDLQPLQDRIMGQLHEQQLTASTENQVVEISQAVTAKGSPVTDQTRGSHPWLGSIAAGLFVVSLSVGALYQVLGPGTQSTTQQGGQLAATPNGDSISNEFIQWAWEDVTGESLVTESEHDPATLLALVELELPVE